MNTSSVHCGPRSSNYGFGGRIFDLGTTFITFGTPPGRSSLALDVNLTGQIVGFTGFGDQLISGGRATLFGFNVTVPSVGLNKDLGTIPGQELHSEAFAVNDAGQIVGRAANPAVNFRFGRAAMFTPPTNMFAPGTVTDLGGLTADRPSEARDINNLGQIVGASELPNGLLRATLFDPTGGGRNTQIGTLGGNSEALGINNQPGGGLIVGWSCITLASSCFEDSPNSRAALFGFGGQVFDLNTLIDPLDPLKPMVNLEVATAINDIGQGQIVANGVFRGESAIRAFLLTPVPVMAAPEPATLGVLAPGLAVVFSLWIRRCRRQV